MTNYKGRPFMLASTENPAMLYSLLACVIGVFVCAFEVFPQLNEYLELVPFPNSTFRNEILCLLTLSTVGALVWDRITTLIFAPRLMWVGYIDAYNTLPSLSGLFSMWLKIFMALVVLGLYAATDNILVLLGAGYMYRQYSTAKKKDEEKRLLTLAKENNHNRMRNTD